MRKLLAICLLVGAGSAHAVPITDPHDIDSSNSVGYTYFTVTSEGYFDIDATNQNNGRRGSRLNPNIDPELFIFVDDGELTRDDELANNNNGGNRRNAQVADFFLAGGSYVAIVSDFNLSVNEAIRGINRNITAGTIDVSISASASNAAAGYTPNAIMTVPEPTSLALLGLGLVAAAGVRRKSSAKA